MSRVPVYSFPSAKDFETWLNYGRRPGQKIAYHFGFLMGDRQRTAALNSLARVVWKAAEQGRVVLTQQRMRSPDACNSRCNQTHPDLRERGHNCCAKYLYLATVV